MTSLAESRGKSTFKYCLNTSTIRGQKLPITEEIDIAAKAGYHSIEPWVSEVEEYVKKGGTPAELKTRIHDHGMVCSSAIGFAEWIVDDPERRAHGVDHMRRDMDLMASIGGTHIAAPPAGATDQPNLNLFHAAERYRAILEIGDNAGVIPMVEVWGFSQLLNRLGQAALIAVEAAHPKACVLADVYHIYKGGSDIAGLVVFNGAALPQLHMNDYPANPPRATITDADRVYPGDGVAPLTALFKDLVAIGFSGYLSLELFNESYWKQDAFTVAKTALDKTKAAVRAAGFTP